MNIAHRLSEIERILEKGLDKQARNVIITAFRDAKRFNQPVAIPLEGNAHLYVNSGAGSYDLRAPDWSYIDDVWGQYLDPESGRYIQVFDEGVTLWADGHLYTAKGDGVLVLKRPSSKSIRATRAMERFMEETGDTK